MPTILQMSLSFSKTLTTTSTPLFLHTKLSHLSLHHHPTPKPSTIIRMGGGPRTFPGGVSKWQWKRMQLKKSKQLLKARLCRERQIYEMRKRAELKAAVTELERPWEVVERLPNLFSVGADEQVKVLADRFQKPGGFDLWTEKDGPMLFQNPAGEGLPSGRFFPKGVVHSVKPYGVIAEESTQSVEEEFSGRRRSRQWKNRGKRRPGKTVDSDRGIERRIDYSSREGEVYYMSLQPDGIYGVREKNERGGMESPRNHFD